MATKKTTGTKSSGKIKTKSATAKNTNTRSSTKNNAKNKTEKQKKGTSKQITYYIFGITVAFMIWACWMMTKTQDLSSIEYIADIVKVALPIGIIAYMFRAVMEDKMELQLKYNEELSKGKVKYGDNYIVEELEVPDFLGRD